MKFLTVLALLFIPLPALASKKPATCSAYLMTIEQDEATVNLQMAGTDDQQSKWYRKDGNQKEYAGVCIVDPDRTGKRVALADGKDDPGHYLETTVGSSPLYVLMWEEHRIFVPNTANGGGHYAYSANGVLYRMDTTGDGKLTAIGPVHDTNRTIFTSSSVSLLKAAIKQVKGRIP